MRYFLIPIAVILLNCSSKKNFVLPKTWTKGLTITLYEGGGMNYESTNVFISADSCNYVKMENGKDDRKRFVLSAKELNELLKKLHAFNVDDIETRPTELVHDKETNRLCIIAKPQPDYCIETGATITVKKKYQEDFYGAWKYLLKLAMDKSKQGD